MRLISGVASTQTAIGFLSGAVAHTGANWYLNYQGAKHRKRSSNQQKLEEANGSGLEIAVGAAISLTCGQRSRFFPVSRHFWAIPFSVTPPKIIIAATTAVAAGAILAMISDTMMLEAFEQTHDFTGLITVISFLIAFVLAKLGG